MHFFVYVSLLFLAMVPAFSQVSTATVENKAEVENPCEPEIVKFPLPNNYKLNNLTSKTGDFYALNEKDVYLFNVDSMIEPGTFFEAMFDSKITDYDHAGAITVFTSVDGYLYGDALERDFHFMDRIRFSDGIVPEDTKVTGENNAIYVVYDNKLVHAGVSGPNLLIYKTFDLEFLDFEIRDILAVNGGLLVMGEKDHTYSVVRVWGFGDQDELSWEPVIQAEPFGGDFMMRYRNGVVILANRSLGARLYLQDENNHLDWVSDLWGTRITAMHMNDEGVIMANHESQVLWVDLSDPSRPISSCPPLQIPTTGEIREIATEFGFVQIATTRDESFRFRRTDSASGTLDFPWVPTNNDFTSDLNIVNLSQATGTMFVTGTAPDGRQVQLETAIAGQSTRNFNPLSFGLNSQNLSLTIQSEVAVKATLRVRGRDLAGEGRPPAMLNPVRFGDMKNRLVFPLVPGDRTAGVAIRAPLGQGETVVNFKLIGASGVVGEKAWTLQDSLATGVLLSDLFPGVVLEDVVSLSAEAGETLLSGSQFSFNQAGHPAGSAALTGTTAHPTEQFTKVLEWGSEEAVSKAAFANEGLALLKSGKVELVDFSQGVVVRTREIPATNILDVTLNSRFLYMLRNDHETAEIQVYDRENLAFQFSIPVTTVYRRLAASDELLGVYAQFTFSEIWLLDADSHITETYGPRPSNLSSQLVLIDNRSYSTAEGTLSVSTFTGERIPFERQTSSRAYSPTGKIGVIGDRLVLTNEFGGVFFTLLADSIQFDDKKPLYGPRGYLHGSSGPVTARQLVDIASDGGDSLYMIDTEGVSLVREDQEKRLYRSGFYKLQNAVQVVSDQGLVCVVTADGAATVLTPSKSYNRVIPWLTAGGDFESRVLIHNDGNHDAEVTLIAVDRMGNQMSAIKQIDAGSVFSAWSGDLFPGMTGYSLRIASEADHLAAAMEVYKSGDLLSPAQMTAPAVTMPGRALEFPYLTSSGLSALVLTQVGDTTETVKVRLRWRTVDGLQAETTSLELQGNQPKAVLIRDIAPRVDGPVAVTVEPLEGVVLSGAAFLFDEYGRPAMSGPQ